MHISPTNLEIYLNDIKKFPIPSHDQERCLIELVQDGNILARDYLISAKLRLVVSIAKSYCNRNVEFLDLIQAGNIGLMQAIDNITPSWTPINSYATWYIKQEIFKALHEQNNKT